MNPQAEEANNNLIDRIELEHNERQEVMRDKNNRVVREDMETLDTY